MLALNGAAPAELRQALRLARDLADRQQLVAVDGGLDSCRAIRRRADLFVGDGDSVRRPLPSDLEVVAFPRDKAFSDLEGAIQTVEGRGVEVLVVAGLLGGRLDHEWGNLLALGARGAGFAAGVAPTGRGLVVVTARGCKLHAPAGEEVSLFSLGAAATVSLRGTRWELERRRLRPGAHGLSNVLEGTLDLTVHRGVVALVHPDPSAGKGV